MTGQRGELADRMIHLGFWMARHYNERFQDELGLTPATARSLLQLDPDHPVPTRELATMLGCDASNVTALVDRLEDARLVERQVEPADRRVKTLVVTDRGREMRHRMEDILDTDSPALDGLTATELKTLAKLVDKAWQNCLTHEAAS